MRTKQGNKCRDELMKAYTDVLISNQVENFVQYKKEGGEITNRSPREEIDANVQRIFENPARDLTDMQWFPCADND